MRTLTLSRERTLKENCNDILGHFYTSDGTPLANVMTGLFAYTDREPYLCNATVGRKVWQPDCGTYRGPKVSEKLIFAIERWLEKGKGYAIVHGRNVPDLSRARLERMPYKITSTKYFYDLGSFGQSDIWNIVSSARNANRRRGSRGRYGSTYSDTPIAVNKSLFEYYTRAMEADGKEEWDYMRRMEPSESDDGHHRRSWTSFIWSDGGILKYDSSDNEIDTQSSYKHYKAVDHAGINRMEFVNTDGEEI